MGPLPAALDAVVGLRAYFAEHGITKHELVDSAGKKIKKVGHAT